MNDIKSLIHSQTFQIQLSDEVRRMRTHTFTKVESVSQLAVRLSARITSSLSLKTWHLVVLQSTSCDSLITSAYLY